MSVVEVDVPLNMVEIVLVLSFPSSIGASFS
jgi:hypothetical protein